MSPCPGVKTLSEETFSTESRLVQLNRLAAEADNEGTAAAAWRRKTAEIGDAFSRMKMDAGGSVSQFAKGAAILRSGLQKVYDQAFEARAESGRKWLIGVSGILLVLVLVLAGIGYRKLGRFGIKGSVCGFTLRKFFSERLLAGSEGGPAEIGRPGAPGSGPDSGGKTGGES